MTFLEDKDFSMSPTIPEYFRGKTIFITGGSGFMGKVLIEKLLYSCSELDRIYILLRSKKNVSPEERLATVYKNYCFDRLRKEKPGLFESKVFIIAGDVSEPSLGISEEDRILLINKTNIIFHAAASVRFDDHLVNAVKLNLRGTKCMMDLAKEVHHLEAFIHVSTSYSNTNRNPIMECIYPPLGDWRDTLEICERMDESLLQIFTAKYLGEMPNTYVFTKQLAEHVVYEEKGNLPLVIIRPSIVISSHVDPFPGYVDNFNGPTGLMAASSKGIVRVLYADPDVNSDYIPVDMSIKGMIIAAWARGITPLNNTDDVPLYNHCIGNYHPFTYSQMASIGCEIVRDYPSKYLIWIPNVKVTKSATEYFIMFILFHILPAIVVDMILRILGMKPVLLKIQRRIYTANFQALGYFTTQRWNFCNKNFLNLRQKLKKEDFDQFNYPIESIDKVDFFKSVALAGKKFLLKEKDDDLIEARRNYQRLVMLDKLLKITFFGLILWWIINLNTTKEICAYLVDFILTL